MPSATSPSKNSGAWRARRVSFVLLPFSARLSSLLLGGKAGNDVIPCRSRVSCDLVGLSVPSQNSDNFDAAKTSIIRELSSSILESCSKAALFSSLFLLGAAIKSNAQVLNAHCQRSGIGRSNFAIERPRFNARWCQDKKRKFISDHARLLDPFQSSLLSKLTGFTAVHAAHHTVARSKVAVSSWHPMHVDTRGSFYIRGGRRSSPRYFLEPFTDASHTQSCSTRSVSACSFVRRSVPSSRTFLDGVEHQQLSRQILSKGVHTARRQGDRGDTRHKEPQPESKARIGAVYFVVHVSGASLWMEV